MDLNFIGCSIVVMALILGATEATEYTVGGSFGWNIPTNESFYSDWASNKSFFVGDGLIFNWAGTHTVGNVSKVEYDNCTKVASAFGGNNGAKFQFNLLETGPYYFICTVGDHCSRGQKFSIDVVESPNSAIPTAQPPNSSASTIESFGVLLLSAFVSGLAMYFFSSTY